MGRSVSVFAKDAGRQGGHTLHDVRLPTRASLSDPLLPTYGHTRP